MPSIQYRMIETMFRTLNVKKMLDKKGDEFEKLLEKMRKQQQAPLKIPYKKLEDRFSIDDLEIRSTRCYVVRQKNRTPETAVLYLFGGGYIMPPDPGDIILCAEIAENTNAEVWFPLYPMAPEHRLVETLASTYHVYEEILKSFQPENVRFFGTSSGGGQALSLCLYIRHEQLPLPLPGGLVLQSPGLQVPPSEKQKEEMEKRSSDDIMIPPGFFDQIAPVLADENDAYLLSPLLADLTGYPPIDIFYGTKEVMYAYLEDMQAACEKYNVPLHVHIGEGMMHCWGAMEFVPEARAVRQEYFAALRKETDTENKIHLEENTVSETLLMPLSGRAYCARKYPDVFPDPDAENIIRKTDYDFSRLNYGEPVMMVWALRRRMMCERISEYLSIHPRATIVNLGCGADSVFSAIDNGMCHFINLDLPDVITAREQLLTCGEREKNVAADAFDLSWTEEIETPVQEGVFITSAGVFMYFEEVKLKQLFTSLAEKFPGGGICFDAENSFGVNRSNKVVEKSGNTGAPIVFAVDDAALKFREWSRHFGSIRTFDKMPAWMSENSSIPFFSKLMIQAAFRMGMLKIVEIMFQ